MFRIVLCDDDSGDLQQMEQCVRHCFFKRNREKVRIDCFSEGNELLRFVREQGADVYFLDVLMPGINGIELGKQIRELDAQVPIVYITSSREYAFEAFDIRAYHYLEKPVSQRAVSKIMDEIFAHFQEEKKKQISIHTREGVVVTETRRIMYVENVSRSPVYVLNDGSKIVGVCNRGSFEEGVHPLDEDEDFIQPHKSFFVNMNHVYTMRNDTLILDN